MRGSATTARRRVRSSADADEQAPPAACRATSGEPSAAMRSRSCAPRTAAFSTRPARSISPSTAFGDGGGERVAAERRAVLALRSRASEAAPNVTRPPIGNAAADALGDRDRVGRDAGVLEGEPLARAPGAGLDLVDDEQRAVRGG